MLGHYLALLFKEVLSQKDLTSQEDLLKRTENLNELTKEPKNLSPLKVSQRQKACEITKRTTTKRTRIFKI